MHQKGRDRGDTVLETDERVITSTLASLQEARNDSPTDNSIAPAVAIGQDTQKWYHGL